MDLFQPTPVRKSAERRASDDDYEPWDIEVSNPSQRSLADFAYSHWTIPSTQDSIVSLAMELERPASCGQVTQNEDQMPAMSGLALSTQFTQHYDTPQDAQDDWPESPVQQLQSIEDWEVENPHVPQQKMVSATVPKSTGEWTTKFQHQCDQHGVRPVFSYEEPSPFSFIAVLEVDGKQFRTETPLSSKKHAKEKVSKMGLAALPPLDKMEGVAKRGTKRKSDAALEGAPTKDGSENWIGILNTHCQRNKYPRPTYEDGRTAKDPPRWSAGVTIDDRPGMPFTSGQTTFASKKDAQATAAKSAVLWLREQGKLEDTPSKRCKGSTAAASDSEDVSMTAADSSKSLLEEVHNLVATLGFIQPRWVATPSTASSSEPMSGTGPFIDMAAHFHERDAEIEPRIRGPIGEVRNCFGQKKAKMACCEKVLPVLLEIKKERLQGL